MSHNKIIIACLVISTLFSCSGTSDENRAINPIETDSITERKNFKDWTDESGTWLDLPLDTLQLIADMDLIDQVNRTDLIQNDPDSIILNTQLDTFIMRDIFAACTCPNWEIITCPDSLQNPSFGGPCKFYIEAAHADLEIRVPYVGTELNVRFIGKKYLKPVKDGEKGEASIGGNIFKYYSFEFIRPYHIYGPSYNDTLVNNNDTTLQTLSSHLTVH
ncbi:MAG: hypothetical protein GQ574_22270 [Crocinitomix sp.]|nr:hypothetical protein [Crocinitomix sp.]